MRIFVVDDERIIRVTLADELKDAGYQVNEFANANAAMRPCTGCIYMHMHIIYTRLSSLE